MKKKSVLIFGLITLLLWSFSCLTLAGEKSRVITPEMVVDLKYVSSVTMDPTGKNIAYIKYQARKPGDKPGSRYSELWVVSTDGKQKQFTHLPIGVSSPAWSPDGKKITFLSRRAAHNDKTQIYIIPVDGGEARPLTDSPTSIRSYHWSPDGKWIAYITTEPATDEEKKQQKAGKDWKVIDTNYKHHQLWSFEVASKKTHKI
ncbi:MAG: TolB family protein, partial [bacterium]